MIRRLRFPAILVFVALVYGVVWLVSGAVDWERVSLPTRDRSESPGEGGVGTAMPGSNAERDQSGAGARTVIWISLDGFSGEYLDRGVTPELDRLRRRALYTDRLSPPFPSLTFPAHATKATGVSVAEHGIPANRYFDRERGRMLSFAGDAELLRAEPIWLTATRQGIRTAVHDWPCSQNQTGPVQTAYFPDDFDGSLSDRQRLEALAEEWENDRGDRPLRLLMGYAKAVDSAGHRYGPDGPGMLPVIEQLDGELGEFVRRARAHFDQVRRIGDELYIIFSADHGMAEIEFNVNVRLALGPALMARLEVATGGNVANLYLKEPRDGGELSPAAAERTLSAIEQRLAETLPFAAAYRADEVPRHWGYCDPHRVGDFIVVLPRGRTFNASADRIIAPIREGGGLRGMHGWAAENVPEMNGMLMILRYPTPVAEARDLGPVDMRQLHPTVARLLEIKPASGADAAPLRW